MHCPRASCEWSQLIKATDQQLLVDRVCIRPDVTLVEDPATGNLRCESYEERDTDTIDRTCALGAPQPDGGATPKT